MPYETKSELNIPRTQEGQDALATEQRALFKKRFPNINTKDPAFFIAAEKYVGQKPDEFFTDLKTQQERRVQKILNR